MDYLRSRIWNSLVSAVPALTLALFFFMALAGLFKQPASGMELVSLFVYGVLLALSVAAILEVRRLAICYYAGACYLFAAGLMGLISGLSHPLLFIAGLLHSIAAICIIAKTIALEEKQSTIE